MASFFRIIKKERIIEKKKILVIDDEPHICTILQNFLEEAEFEVLVATNGKEGIEIAKEQNPDAILLDIKMPEINGIEVCSILKEDPTTKNILIFMLSALSRMGDMEDALKVGADGYFTKPFDRAIVEKIKHRLTKLSKKKSKGI